MTHSLLYRQAVKHARQSGVEFQNANAVRRLSYVHHRINERHAMLTRIRAATENGKIAIVRDGMDCDCTQYHDVKHVDAPLSVVEFMWREDEHRQWLDGPEYVSIVRPSGWPERRASADRALEAYENGHPSRVEWGDL